MFAVAGPNARPSPRRGCRSRSCRRSTPAHGRSTASLGSVSRTIAEYGSWPSWCPARRWTFAVRIACSRPHQPGDDVQGEVLPRGHAAGSDDTVGLGREHEDRRRIEVHARVLRAEQIGVGPMAGARSALEEARLGQQQRSRADRGDERPRACICRSHAASRTKRPRGAVVIGVYRSQTMITS